MNSAGRPKKYPEGFPCPGCDSVQEYYCSNLCETCYRRELDARRYKDPEIRAQRIKSASEWNKANPERRKELKAVYYAANPTPTKERSKEWYWQGDNRVTSKVRKYGITKEVFYAMAEAQNGACAICKEVPSGKGRDVLHVDHDHGKTGPEAVRQLLCFSCNLILGHVEKKGAMVIDAMQTYLAKHNTQG